VTFCKILGSILHTPPKPVILILGTSLQIVSGISTHLQQLFQSPLNQKFQYEHFETGGQGKNESLLRKLKRLLLSPLQLAIFILQAKPDLLHLNTSMDSKAFCRDAVYLLVAKILRRKVIYQIHGGKLPQEFGKADFLFQKFLKLILTLPEAVVVLSEQELQAYRNLLLHQRIELIPNAIELTPYSAATEKQFNSQELKLVYLGALTESKGILETLEAMASLKAEAKFVGIKYFIAGNGKMEQRLRQKVEQLGLQEFVEFTGSIFGQDKISFWLSAHLFIFPSYNEGLPYTLLESIASGTPVITTPVGGIRDVIQDGVHGIMVKPKDSGEIASAISRLIHQPDLLKKMSLKCIERSRENYGVVRMSGQFAVLYESFLREV
jgi:glycosyltransferase involved in cell wall biosynthesis